MVEAQAQNFINLKEKQDQLSVDKSILNILDHDKLQLLIEEHVYSNQEKEQFFEMLQTRYANRDGRTEFYGKLKHMHEFERKDILQKDYRSIAFLKETSKLHIVPNPIGVVNTDDPSVLDLK